MNSRVILIIYLVIVNMISLGFMAADKIRAMEHRFRIPESVLLILACIGGSIGSIIGMFLFHHKIRRAKFRLGLPAILTAQILLYVLLSHVTSQVIYL